MHSYVLVPAPQILTLRSMGVSDVIWDCLNNITHGSDVLREAEQLIRECHQYQQSRATIVRAQKLADLERELRNPPK